MGIIGEAIKNRVNHYDKYGQNQEKVGQVLDIDKANNLCTVSIINRDGVLETVYDVPVKKNHPSLTQWRPYIGELVEIAEVNKRLMIVDRFNENITSDNRKIEDDNYSSAINCSAGGYAGMM